MVRETPDVSTPPTQTCPYCLAEMSLSAQGVRFELGVDINYRRWICTCGQGCEQTWLVTE